MRVCILFDDFICRYVICRCTIYVRDASVEPISENYKYIDLLSVDGSSLFCFSLELYCCSSLFFRPPAPIFFISSIHKIPSTANIQPTVITYLPYLTQTLSI